MQANDRLELRSDLELAALSATGERAAFGQLVRRHQAAVRGLLRRMGAQAAEADDVAQDAFLAAFRQAAHYRGEGGFAAWVGRIAARLYVRRWRRDRILTGLEQIPEEAGCGGEAGAVTRLDLDDALTMLSPNERLCVALCFGAGFSAAETAEALNAPLGTVKSHLKRGMIKLRRHLASDENVPIGRRDHG